MNSPEDEIPLPSIGVLSEEESAKQLREDMCRRFEIGGYVAANHRILELEQMHKDSVSRCLQLETQLEGVSSALMTAHRDLDAANRRVKDLEKQLKRIYDVATGQEQVAFDDTLGMVWIAEYITEQRKIP